MSTIVFLGNSFLLLFMGAKGKNKFKEAKGTLNVSVEKAKNFK